MAGRDRQTAYQPTNQPASQQALEWMIQPDEQYMVVLCRLFSVRFNLKCNLSMCCVKYVNVCIKLFEIMLLSWL